MSARFAYTGYFHVFQQDDGKWESECLECAHIDDTYVDGDVSEDVSLYAEGLIFPEEEGLYKVWAIVRIHYSRDYWGEVDVDYYPDVEEITKLSPETTEKFYRYYPEFKEQQ